MALAVHAPIAVHYSCDQKCGEVRMTSNAEHFQLICSSCIEVYEKLNDFILHIRRCHCRGASTSPRSVKTDIDVITKDPLEVEILQTIKIEPLIDCGAGLSQKLYSDGVSCLEANYVETKQSDISNTTPTTVSNIEKQKLITFIDAVKRSPVLWDPKHVDFFNESSKSEALECVANILNMKFHNFQLNGKVVMMKIKNLYHLWLSIRTGERKADWFYDRLQFLESINKSELEWYNTTTDSQKSNVEDKSYERNHATVVNDKEVAPSSLKISGCTTTDQISYFIDLYRKHELLWNCEHTDYLNKFEQSLAYTEIASEMSKKYIGIHFSPTSIQKSSIDLQILCNKMWIGEISKPWFYDRLQFLYITKNLDEQNFMTDTNLLEELFARNTSNILATNELLRETDDLVFEEVAALAIDSKINDEFDRMSECSLFEGFEETVCNDSMIDERFDKKKRVLSREATYALIQLYRDKPILWNRDDPDFFTPSKRNRVMEELTATLNQRCQLELSVKDIKNKLSALRYIVRRPYKNSEYYEHLLFIPKDSKLHYKCSYCEKEFTVHKQWLLHEYAHSKIKKYKCKDCSRSFLTPLHLRSHQAMHMRREAYSYLCDVCGERFRKREELQVHSYKHTGDWPHVCDICQMGFGKIQQLITHTRTHTGEKPFMCPECGKMFRTLSCIVVHRKRHTQDRAHECGKCGKRFYTKSKMNQHMNLHTKKHVYSCDECDKQFYSNNCLRVHKLIHSSDRRYECRECGQRFKQVASRYSHMKKKHGYKKRES